MRLPLLLLCVVAGILAMPEPRPEEEDLVDLYVQHMDETMGTQAYYERLRAEKEAKSAGQRHKRSVIESPLFQLAKPVKQSLRGDDRSKAKKKIPYEKDGLDFPNTREENSDQETDIVDKKFEKRKYWPVIRVSKEGVFKSMSPEEVEEYLMERKAKKPTYLDKVEGFNGENMIPVGAVKLTRDGYYRRIPFDSIQDYVLHFNKSSSPIHPDVKRNETKVAVPSKETNKTDVENTPVETTTEKKIDCKKLAKARAARQHKFEVDDNPLVSNEASPKDDDFAYKGGVNKRFEKAMQAYFVKKLAHFTEKWKTVPKNVDDVKNDDMPHDDVKHDDQTHGDFSGTRSRRSPVTEDPTHTEVTIERDPDFPTWQYARFSKKTVRPDRHLTGEIQAAQTIDSNEHTDQPDNSEALGLGMRFKRSINSQHKNMHFSRREKLDENGDVILEWDPTDDENVTFRVSAKTLGYVGLGFNDKSHMMGADIVLAWVDDHTHVPTLLDSHGVESANAAPETDASQDVHLIHGSQNGTHTVITFTRRWQTCDPQDRSLTADTIRVLWALHQTDPELNAARFHGDRRGGRALRLKAAAPHPPPSADDPDMIKWDVKLNQFTVTNTTETVYWCKIFKAPKFSKKHHMIGYTPLVEKANEAIVHHVILYECASTQPILAEYARIAGAHCYSPTMPKEWDSCLQPVLAWARGSRGEWLPEHVGLPIAEHQEGSYYMLEVHYNNKVGRQVMDSSGVRLHLTPNTRRMEAGIMVAGVAVSPLHMVPPQQKEYATAGYCTAQCTNKMFDEDGINVVSVVLHSHLSGRRLSLKHIRQGKELPPIVQDNHFDFDYQQSHTLEREVKILPGDELVAECVYDTRGRTKPTFGGYAATQEMCLAFVLHYPRSPLAACYSMTPVKEFFNALNVQSFKGVSMEQVEKLFLSTTTETVTLPVSPNHHSPMYPDLRSNDDVDVDIIRQTKSALISKGDYIDYDDIFARLVIEKPDEFKDHTLSDHITALAWNDTALSKSIERSLYHGKHVTFCRTREDRLPRSPTIQMFPNYTALPESNDTRCKEFHAAYGSTASANLFDSLLLPLVLLLTAALLP